jgi:hypothetical protein
MGGKAAREGLVGTQMEGKAEMLEHQQATQLEAAVAEVVTAEVAAAAVQADLAMGPAPEMLAFPVTGRWEVLAPQAPQARHSVAR